MPVLCAAPADIFGPTWPGAEAEAEADGRTSRSSSLASNLAGPFDKTTFDFQPREQHSFQWDLEFPFGIPPSGSIQHGQPTILSPDSQPSTLAAQSGSSFSTNVVFESILRPKISASLIPPPLTIPNPALDEPQGVNFQPCWLPSAAPPSVLVAHNPRFNDTAHVRDPYDIKARAISLRLPCVPPDFVLEAPMAEPSSPGPHEGSGDDAPSPSRLSELSDATAAEVYNGADSESELTPPPSSPRPPAPGRGKTAWAGMTYEDKLVIRKLYGSVGASQEESDTDEAGLDGDSDDESPRTPYAPVPLPQTPAAASLANSWKRKLQFEEEDDAEFSNDSESDGGGDSSSVDEYKPFAGPSSSAGRKPAAKRGSPPQKRHSKIRKVEKESHHCPVPGCGQWVSREADMRRHLRTHDKANKGAACPKCGKVLSRLDALKRHVDKGSCGKSQRVTKKRRN
ncbi:hypothetical protein BOTBODRAFT_172800 [Botryobasidium botryosum FD-172 SS1]|uniref:C2H2-type domain-containing protein n=1 Tax=Botryobasidium botryosum (strain FD-172 SS1) TaxID=930990 RepID=A0A067MM98_BOTB1|nr:hypothetical protein BOTBODRAFT_172800 [Botryobasidium botryosum FD-172 SS1]